MEAITVKSTTGDKDKGTYDECQVVVNRPTTLAEYVELLPEVAIVNALGAYWKQNATQGPKAPWLEAVLEHGPGSDEAEAAKSEYQTKVPEYVYTGTKTRGDGVKQKESQAFTRNLQSSTANLDDDATMTMGELRALMAEENVPVVVK